MNWIAALWVFASVFMGALVFLLVYVTADSKSKIAKASVWLVTVVYLALFMGAVTGPWGGNP